jgi:hypothetical protein
MSLYCTGKNKDIWAYNFWFDGKRYNGRIGKVTKTKAKTVYAQVKAEARTGRYPLPASIQTLLFDDFLVQFLTWYRVGHAASSIARYSEVRAPGADVA